MIKKLTLNFLLIFFSTIFIFLIIEFFLYKNPSIFPTLGWQNNNILNTKIKKCKNNSKSVGVFGDSFVEFYGGSEINLVQQLNLKSKKKYFCNFGLSGTDINEYINRFLYVKEKLNLNEVIFFIYEGNDFKLKDKHLNDKILVFDKNLKIDRKLNYFNNFVKSTYILNLFHRHIFKKFFYKKNYIDNEYLIKLYEKRKDNESIEITLNEVLEKHNNFPKKKLTLLNSDVINRNIYITSLLHPNYFTSFNNPTKVYLEKQKKILDQYFIFINKVCNENKIKCNFILIPEANFISKEYRNEFYKFFEFKNPKSLNERSSIIYYLTKNYKNFYYPNIEFNYYDYVRLDGHLSAGGNEKLSNFVIDKLYN